MTDTLFDLPDSPSPRLEWMRRHGLLVGAGNDGRIYVYRSVSHTRIAGCGDTELEALTDFAINNNLKLWNEE